MTPQSNLMILAAVDPQREESLRALLASMNHAPGIFDALNTVVPFGKFERVHFARILILDDKTLADIEAYGLPPVLYPKYLALTLDFDGLPEPMLIDLAGRAEDGLRKLFSHCDGYSAEVNLLAWMQARSIPSAASYVNWSGRTMVQVREEESLHQSLQKFIRSHTPAIQDMPPREAHAALKQYATSQLQSGAVTLTPPAPTPAGWELRNLIRLIGIPLLALILSPLLVLCLPFFLVQLRRLERTDPEIAPRVDAAYANGLALIEDHDVTNQFSAMGSLKPGLFRRATIIAVLAVIDYTAKHIFNRGRLGRVTTIHFARWVFLDNERRVIFMSNYDGSLESYMDDFINKVAFGLNVVFSNGLGYPRTNWLILDGAKDEQKFKDYLRRHQLPTQVWYNAHPGLTALDRKRNALIREGLEQTDMTDSAIRNWLQLL